MKNFYFSHRLELVFILGCIIGVIQFIFLYGTACLSPFNTVWMINAGSDAYVHYIGWECFKSEAWNFPLGKINSICFPLGSAIVFTDSIPWFAIPWKYLCHIFHLDKFQYFGIYGLLSFALQGGFSAIILKKYIHQEYLCLACATIFIYSEPMINRMFGHTALGGHFLILGGIAVFIYSKQWSFLKKIVVWSLLCGIAVCNHPYIGFMLCMIFSATCIYYIVILKQSLLRCIGLFFTVALITGGLFYIAGGFIGEAADEFHLLGQAALNLNSLFDSYGNSRLFPSLEKSPTLFYGEGYQFLGIGIIFLFPMAAVGMIKEWKCYRFRMVFEAFPIILLSLFLFILSLSPTVYFGNHLILQYEVPQTVAKMWEIFRSSGRLFWPVFYIISIATIVFSYRALKQGPIACIIICLAVFGQIYDLSPHRSCLQQRFEQRFGENRVSLPVYDWASILANIEEIDLVDPFALANDDIRFMELAAHFHLRTNTIYGSRFNAGRSFKYAQDLIRYTERENKLPENHLFVFTDKYAFFRCAKALDLKKTKLFVKNGYLCAINIDNFNSQSDVELVSNISKMNFIKYILTFSDEKKNKLIIFSARLDGISKLSIEERSLLYNIGLLKNCPNLQNESYIAIFNEGFSNMIAEKWADDLLSYHLDGFPLKSDLLLATRGSKIPWGGNWFDAVLLKDNKVVSPQANGLTIYIYDIDKNIFDEIAFFEGENEGIVIPGNYFLMMLP